MTQLVIWNEPGPVHELGGSRSRNLGEHGGAGTVKNIAVDGTHEHEVRWTGARRGDGGMCPNNHIEVLVRIETSDVHEPRCPVREARVGRGLGDVIGRITRTVRRRRRFDRDTNALGGHAMHVLDLARRKVRHREDDATLPEREARLEAPENACAPRRKRQLGKTLGDRVVHRDDCWQTRRQGEKRVHRRGEKHIGTLAPHGLRKTEHVAERAASVRGGGDGGRCSLFHDDDTRTGHVALLRSATIGKEHELIERGLLDHGVQELSGETTVPSSVGQARGIDGDFQRPALRDCLTAPRAPCRPAHQRRRDRTHRHSKRAPPDCPSRFSAPHGSRNPCSPPRHRGLRPACSRG